MCQSKSSAAALHLFYSTFSPEHYLADVVLTDVFSRSSLLGGVEVCQIEGVASQMKVETWEVSQVKDQLPILQMNVCYLQRMADYASSTLFSSCRESSKEEQTSVGFQIFPRNQSTFDTTP